MGPQAVLFETTQETVGNLSLFFFLVLGFNISHVILFSPFSFAVLGWEGMLPAGPIIILSLLISGKVKYSSL